MATFLFRGTHVSPPSSVRNAPAAEIAAYICFGSFGSIWIEWQLPPAPGCHCSRVSCWTSPITGDHVSPLSSDRKSAPGVAPRNSVSGSLSWPGACQTSSSFRPVSSGSPRPQAVPGLPEVARALHGPAVDEVVAGDVEGSPSVVLHRVEDRPPGEQRALELPVAAVFVAAEQEAPRVPRSSRTPIAD